MAFAMGHILPPLRGSDGRGDLRLTLMRFGPCQGHTDLTLRLLRRIPGLTRRRQRIIRRVEVTGNPDFS